MVLLMLLLIAQITCCACVHLCVRGRAGVRACVRMRVRATSAHAWGPGVRALTSNIQATKWRDA